MKYLVMENHFSYSIVLDEEGHFIKVANMNYEVGDTIEDIYPINSKNSNSKKTTLLLATIAACFILLFTTIFNQPLTTYATVYITINPKISIDVTEDSKVILINPLNSDGKKLIEDYKWKNKNLNEVSDELTKKSIDLEFLKDGDTVNIEIDSPTNNWFDRTSYGLRKNLEKSISKKLSINIEIKKFGNNKKKTVKPKTVETDSTEIITEPTIKPTSPSLTETQPNYDNNQYIAPPVNNNYNSNNNEDYYNNNNNYNYNNNPVEYYDSDDDYDDGDDDDYYDNNINSNDNGIDDNDYYDDDDD